MKLTAYSISYDNAGSTYTVGQCNIIGVFRDELRRVFYL
jgi:hypothetical protein